MEHHMPIFTRSHTLLASVSAAALAGTALATLLAGGITILADAAPAVADISLASADTVGPRLHHLEDQHRQRKGTGLFQSGPAAGLRLQSRRGAARVPSGAKA